MKRAWSIYRSSRLSFDDYTLSLLVTNMGTMAFLQRDMETFQETLVKHYPLVRQQSDDELVASASLIMGVVKTIIREHEDADLLLQISLERYRRISLTTGISLALSALGRNAVYDGQKLEQAKKYYTESMALARQEGNEISVIICLSGFALCEVMAKSSDAKNYLRESILMSQSLHFYEALAWSLEIWALVSINEGKLIHAVTLMGAVNHLREITQLPVWEDLQAIIMEAKHKLSEQMEPDIFRMAWNRGSEMNLETMADFAMNGESLTEVPVSAGTLA